MGGARFELRAWVWTFAEKAERRPFGQILEKRRKGEASQWLDGVFGGYWQSSQQIRGSVFKRNIGEDLPEIRLYIFRQKRGKGNKKRAESR